MKKLFCIILSVLLVISVCLCSGCDLIKPKDGGNTEATIEGGSNKSILKFNDDEGSKELVKAFEEGKAPKEVRAMYDQMGSNPEIVITDEETIKKLYDYLSLIEIEGETNESITDCYHYISFAVSDSLSVSYSFEGTEIWRYNNKGYKIKNSGKMFSLIESLTDEYKESVLQSE